ncbi:MAG TPA: class I mannose-6-phosphate isomerase [Clostridia bacterium]|nr:class I mannose-6-phosphate isomerase [Clostridia bacterium]
MNAKELEKISSQPIFFERNRVFRVYRGGKLFSGFFGDPDEDSSLPEEWVASGVKALNRESKSEFEGVSRVKGTDIYFNRLLENCKEQLLGQRASFDILVKVLDSAIRLPVQAHPDRAFSRKYFNSNFGKTEAWLILATRKNASIFFGFKDGITEEDFRQAIKDSEHDKTAMEKLICRVPAKPGDVYLIPAKTVHAIGYGCLILEIQEPTDFTIQPEAWCGDYRLNDYEMYLGIPVDTAMECFDFTINGKKALEMGKKEPRLIASSNSYRSESLISYDDTECFALNRHFVKGGSMTLSNAPSVILVLDGKGEITGKDYVKSISKGDYFFFPYSACGKFDIKSDTGITTAECLCSKL